MKRPLRLATRASPLALWQARHVAGLLHRAHPGLRIELVTVVSTGDADRTTPLYGMGNVGVFVKEVQERVDSGEADVGVHSCKDLPTDQPEGFALAAILLRGDPRDALIGAASVQALPHGALIGTSSLRRQSQLAALRPDLRFAVLRGNVETRLRKVQAGEVAATLLAMAGLSRLGLARQAGAVPLHPEHECTPAAAQGAIALDCRDDDLRTRLLLAPLHDEATGLAIGIERSVLAGLRGGCSLPLGCWARRDHDGRWRLTVRLGGTGHTLQRLDLVGPGTGLAERALSRLRLPR